MQEPLRTLSPLGDLLGQRYRGQMDEEADKILGFMTDAAKRMSTLIDDLLARQRLPQEARAVPHSRVRRASGRRVDRPRGGQRHRIPAGSGRKHFAPFKRLHSTREYPGSGIGLAACKRIVESYGGRIGAESTPGEGAAFWFTVPVSDPDRERFRDSSFR